MPASDYYIGANDEHGMNPPTAGKRSPVLPYLGRPFYENEFNRSAKIDFIIACLRCGFRVYDVKPEITDTDINTRVARVNRQGLTLLVTFAYNAFGSGTNFNSANGYAVYYSPYTYYSDDSRALSEDVYEQLSATGLNGRGVLTLDNVAMLSKVNCPSTLLECGFMTNFDEAKLMQDPDFTRIVGESTTRGVCDFLDVPFVSAESYSYPTLTLGSRGNSVLALQYLLLKNGKSVNVDGIYGIGTRAAVTAFQADNGLAADGIVGADTWRALVNANPTAYTLREGDRSSPVYYAQRKLLSKLYPVELNGIFDNAMSAAVRDFQTENGLNPDGIIGANTWRALATIGGGRPRLY